MKNVENRTNKNNVDEVSKEKVLNKKFVKSDSEKCVAKTKINNDEDEILKSEFSKKCSATEENCKKYLTQIENLNEEINAIKDKNLRLMAEFDNFKKRSAKEKSETYNNAKADCVESFLSVLDNLERAVEALNKSEGGDLKKGIELIISSFNSSLQKLGVEEIKSQDEVFDPGRHNAINVVEDENYGHNIICKVLQKGYSLKDLVIRPAMVVVANP